MRIFYIIVLLSTSLLCNAQSVKTSTVDLSKDEITVEPLNADPDFIYDAALIDKLPEFPGGSMGLNAFIKSEIKTPKTNDGPKTIKAYTSFVVEKDGEITNVKLLKDPGYNMSEEVIRVMQLSPKWKPGIKNGTIVRSSYKLPIIITLS